MKIKNARIASTTLGYEDHGILTFNLDLHGASWSQGFGGWPLDRWDAAQKQRVGQAGAIERIAVVLKVVGVDSWEQLEGKLVRVRWDTDESDAISAIGNIVDDTWTDGKKQAYGWKVVR